MNEIIPVMSVYTGWTYVQVATAMVLHFSK